MVRIALFEYECCQTVPAVDVTLTGKLFGFPVGFPNGQVIVDEWDRELDLVRFVGGSARWDPQQGNPFDQPVGIWLSWHSEGEPGVSVIGRAIETRQVFRDDDHEETRGLPVLQKFPKDEVVAADGTTLQPADSLVTLGDLVLVEPMLDELAAYRAAQARGRRTLQVTGPAVCFGDVVPGRGERVRIDLDDVRLNVSGASDGAHGIVIGLTQQVSVMRPFGLAVDGCNMSMMVDVQAGQPASSITDDLFVVLVVDEEWLP